MACSPSKAPGSRVTQQCKKKIVRGDTQPSSYKVSGPGIRSLFLNSTKPPGYLRSVVSSDREPSLTWWWTCCVLSAQALTPRAGHSRSESYHDLIAQECLLSLFYGKGVGTLGFDLGYPQYLLHMLGFSPS